MKVKNLLLIHTVPKFITYFDNILKPLLPHVVVRHVVAESVLKAVIANGAFLDKHRSDLDSLVQNTLFPKPQLVCITCTSIGEYCEHCKNVFSIENVIRIDDPILDYAASNCKRVALVGTLPTALASTESTLRQKAQNYGTIPMITKLLLEPEWNVVPKRFGELCDKFSEWGRDYGLIIFAQMSTWINYKQLVHEELLAPSENIVGSEQMGISYICNKL